MGTPEEIDAFRARLLGQSGLEDWRNSPKADFLLALIGALLQEINTLRNQHSLSPKTLQNYVDGIRDLMDDLTQI